MTIDILVGIAFIAPVALLVAYYIWSCIKAKIETDKTFKEIEKGNDR